MRMRAVALLGGSIVVVLAGLARFRGPIVPAHPMLVEYTPRDEDEARPTLIAWECARSSRPTFVVYDDRTWLRDPMTDAACGERFVGGSLTPEDAAAVFSALSDADLLAMPRYLNVRPDTVANSIVLVYKHGDRWIGAAVGGMDARAPREHHVRAGSGVPSAPTEDLFIPAYVYATPVPEPFLDANDLLIAFGEREAAPYSPPDRWVVSLQLSDSSAEDVLGPPRDWQVVEPTLPRLDNLTELRIDGRLSPMAGGNRRRQVLVRIPNESVTELRAELARGDWFRYGELRVWISLPFQPLVAEDEIIAVYDAFVHVAGIVPDAE